MPLHATLSSAVYSEMCTPDLPTKETDSHSLSAPRQHVQEETRSVAVVVGTVWKQTVKCALNRVNIRCMHTQELGSGEGTLCHGLRDACTLSAAGETRVVCALSCKVQSMQAVEKWSTCVEWCVCVHALVL